MDVYSFDKQGIYPGLFHSKCRQPLIALIDDSPALMSQVPQWFNPESEIQRPNALINLSHTLKSWLAPFHRLLMLIPPH